MEHNVYVFPPFVLVGPLLQYFFVQRQCFGFLTLSLVYNGIVICGQYSKLWQYILFFSGGKVIRPYGFSLPDLPGFHCYNPGQKSLGQY